MLVDQVIDTVKRSKIPISAEQEAELARMAGVERGAQVEAPVEEPAVPAGEVPVPTQTRQTKTPEQELQDIRTRLERDDRIKATAGGSIGRSIQERALPLGIAERRQMEKRARELESSVGSTSPQTGQTGIDHLTARYEQALAAKQRGEKYDPEDFYRAERLIPEQEWKRDLPDLPRRLGGPIAGQPANNQEQEVEKYIGQTLPVPGFPGQSFTVIGRASDGDVQIQKTDGTILDIPLDKFLSELR
jgi:hypothetical protein